MPEPAELEEALRLGSATLHESYGRAGDLLPTLRPIAPGMRLAGPATTVRCPVGDNLWLHEAIYAAAPGSILVVETEPGPEYGYWGEITTTAAMAQSLGGLVIDGGVRDTERIAELGFPVFSRSVCIRGTVKAPGTKGAVDVEVTCGGALVRPGDVIVGDADGLVAIPADAFAGVVRDGTAREAREQLTMDRIRAGERTIDKIRTRLAHEAENKERAT